MDLTNPSIRRLISIILAPVFAFASAKLGVHISDEVQEAVIMLIGLYIVAGNTKETLIHRAEAAGQKKADELTRE
jgi:hypothetical protein